MSAPPTPPDWLEILRQWWTPIVGILGAVWAFVSLRRRLSAKEREEQRLQAKAIRYLVDGLRIGLRVQLAVSIHDEALYDELVRQKALLDGIRDEFWVHDGHASSRETERIAEVLTRTQRIQLKAKVR